MVVFNADKRRIITILRYLSYPMGPALNITTETTARDFDAWVGSGLTCLENGGMAHPIHAISLLLAKEHNASYERLASDNSGPLPSLTSVFFPEG